MYENLKQLIINNRRATNFDLNHWVHDCGTFGCLVGNDLLARFRKGNCRYDRLMVSESPIASMDGAALEYGITFNEAFFLFGVSHIGNYHKIRNTRMRTDSRDPYNHVAAIARVEKFIAWKESYEDRLVATLRQQRLDREARKTRTRTRRHRHANVPAVS